MTARPRTDGPPLDKDIVCCTAGGRNYAFRGGDVREIARAEQMRAEDGAGGRVGLLDLDGQAVPVFALRRVLSGDAPPVAHDLDGNRFIAVTGAGEAQVGWLVDRIARTDMPADAAVAPLPELVGGWATRWFDAVVRLGGTSLLRLAPRNLHPDGARTPDTGDAGLAAFQPPIPGCQPDPTAVIFSTSVLPQCQASRFALSGRQVVAVVPPTPPMVVPGCGRHVTGVSWWRDAAVPVLDFREPGERVKGASRGRRLVARCGGKLRGALIAFAIESEVALHRPAPGDRSAEGVECPPFAAGMFSVAGETIALLELDDLVGQLEVRSEK